MSVRVALVQLRTGEDRAANLARGLAEIQRAAAEGAGLVVPQAGTIGEWPEGLFEAELRVAAFQNGYFVALCNRVGEEPNLTFAGESFVCDPAGRVIGQAGEDTEETLSRAREVGTR